MSVIFKLKNVSYGNSNLPVLKRTVLGFPQDGLAGLYLMEDGTLDSGYSGLFSDSSGLGNHAARRGNWTSPVRKSYGMQIGGNYGLCVQTPVPVTPNLTWIIVAQETTVIRPDGYPTFFGPSSGISATESANHGNNYDFVINADNQNTAYGSLGIYQSGQVGYSDDWPGVSTRPIIPNTAGDSATPTVIGVSFDNVSGNVIAKTQKAGSRVVLTGLQGQMNEYSGNTTTNVCFGIWKHSGMGGNLTGKVMLAACYNKALSEGDLDLAMLAARKRVESRGIVFAN